MSSTAEFRVLLVGTGVLANRALHRHLRHQYLVNCVGRATDVSKMTIDHAPDVVNPGLKIFPVSAYTGEGLDAWYAWLRGELAAMTVLP